MRTQGNAPGKGPRRLAGRGRVVLAALAIACGAAVAQESTPPPAPPPDAPAATQEAGESAPPAPAEVQLSFTNAKIDLLVKWLGQMTGKSVIKDSSVNVTITILSPRQLPVRTAIEQVYRALSLQGIKVIELRDAIVILPEATETKIGPELASIGDAADPGRVFRVQTFPIEHARASVLKDKVKVVLSGAARVEVDDASNKLIVSDYSDNLTLVAELVKELDVTTGDTRVSRVFPLEHAKADDLAPLITALYSAAPAAAKEGEPAPPAQPAHSVRVVADKTNNRLIVTAPPDAFPQIEGLLAQLDVEEPVDVVLRELPLKHVDAKDLVEEIRPMYQKISGTALKDLIEISAHSRSNSLIVLSSQANYDRVRELVGKLDTEGAQGSVARQFKLENADAEEIASQLEDLFREDTGYYSYYYYRRQMESADEEMRFVANRRLNTVTAIGPPNLMEKVEMMIRELDQPLDSDTLAPRIYKLKFVDAFDIERVLNELLLRRERRRSYWDWEFGYDEEQRDIGRLYGKVRITSELYTNSLIVSSNSPENFAAIEDILEQLDRPQGTDTTINIKLRHSKAVTLSNNLNVLFAAPGSPPRRPENPQQPGQPNQPRTGSETASMSFELEDEAQEEAYFPWLGGGNQGGPGRPGADGRTTTYRPVSDLVGKVRVVPDMRTNSLMVTTSAHFFPQVLKVIHDLDVPTPQVLIEATIVEVAGDFRDRLGVRWSPDGARVFEGEDFDDSFIGSASGEYSKVFAGGLLDEALKRGILDVNANLDVLIQFLRKNSESQVKASPRINVADNEKGKLFVGARIPFITGSLNTVEGGRNDTFRYQDVGIILEVTPHINDEGEVTLRIRVESSQVRPGETLFGGAIIDTRNYRTDLTVSSGQTIVLGGINQWEQSEIERKVPLLGDIPLFGWLFKKVDSVERKVELMVFLKPTVTRTPEDVRKLLEEEREATPGIQEWEKELEETQRMRRRHVEG